MVTAEERREYMRLYRQANKARLTEYHRQWLAARPGYDQRQRYKLTKAAFDCLMVEQDNKCALCHEPLPDMKEGRMGPHVDHDHETGKVRGILCPVCNKHRVPVLEWLNRLGLYTHPYLKEP